MISYYLYYKCIRIYFIDTDKREETKEMDMVTIQSGDLKSGIDEGKKDEPDIDAPANAQSRGMTSSIYLDVPIFLFSDML